jgi:hypothetical protein
MPTKWYLPRTMRVAVDVFRGPIWLSRLPETYESIQNRFYGLVAREFAAAHLGDEFVGAPVHPMATERQRSLSDSRSLSRGTGCGIVHAWLMSQHRKSCLAASGARISFYSSRDVSVCGWAGAGAAKGAT